MHSFRVEMDAIWHSKQMLISIRKISILVQGRERLETECPGERAYTERSERDELTIASATKDGDNREIFKVKIERERARENTAETEYCL